MNLEEIIKEFNEVKGLNEAKKIYKKLAKILHPDIGGTDKEFKILNTVYNDFIKEKIYFSNDSKIDLELEKIISQILHIENIVIELIGSWIWISGDTKNIKELLKELNFRWASKKKMWYFGEKIHNGGKTKSMKEIKTKYKTQTFGKKAQAKIS